MQSLKLEEKRVGATFAAMLRRHQLDWSDSNDCVLKIVCVLNSTSFHVKQVKYFSVVLQVISSIKHWSYTSQAFCRPYMLNDVCFRELGIINNVKGKKKKNEMASIGTSESVIYNHVRVYYCIDAHT